MEMEQQAQQQTTLDPTVHYSLEVLCESNQPDHINHPDRRLQRMDFPTARNFAEKAHALGLMEMTPVTTIYPKYKAPTVEEVQKYIPDRQWYADALHEDSIHGTMHAMRVFFNVNLLGQMLGLSESDKEILKVTAMIHDLQRVDDREDPKHPTAGAEWFRHNYYLLEQRGIELTKQQRQTVELLTAHHMDHYNSVPTKYQTLLQIFKAADGGDLYRTANARWWPKPEYFDDLFLKIATHHNATMGPSILDNATALRDTYLRFNANFALTSQYIKTRDHMHDLDAVQKVGTYLGALQESEQQLRAPECPKVSVATIVQEKSPNNMQEFKKAILDALWDVKKATHGEEIWLVSGKVSGQTEQDRDRNEQKLRIVTAKLQKQHPTRVYFTSAQIMSPRIRKLLTDSMSHLTKDEIYQSFIDTWEAIVKEAGQQQLLDGVISVKDWEKSSGAKAERHAAEIQHLRLAKYRRRTTPLY